MADIADRQYRYQSVKPLVSCGSFERCFPMSVRKEPQRFNERLEALRGVAAICVAVGHSFIWLVVGSESTIWNEALWQIHGAQARVARWLISIFSGAAAVDLFFVLSGFVLAKSFTRTSFSVAGYLRFATRRIFRIFPAYWASLLIVAAYLWLVFPSYVHFDIASPWFQTWYRNPLHISDFIDNAFFRPAWWMNPNAWTLPVELIASAMLPAVVWAIGDRVARGLMVIIALAAVSCAGFPSSSVWHYLYMFAIGATLAHHEHSIGLRVAAQRWFGVVSLCLIVIGNLAFPLSHSLPADLLIVAGCAGIVAANSGDRTSRLFAVLDSRWARYLGRLSYSFYLLHFVVLYAVARYCLTTVSRDLLLRWPIVAMALVCVISITIAMPMALVSYRFIERPSTELGRRISRMAVPWRATLR